MNDRSVCILICCFKKLRCRNVNITIKTFVAERGLGLKMTTWRTFSRRLNENGYGFFHARNKGLLSERDRKKRRTYARNMKCCLLQKNTFRTHFIWMACHLFINTILLAVHPAQSHRFGVKEVRAFSLPQKIRRI